MSFERVEEVCVEYDDLGRYPVEVAVEVQQKIRDDQSRTRPFVKVKLSVGKRSFFCEVDEAEKLASMISSVLPNAHGKVDELKQSFEKSRRKRQDGR